MHRCLGLDDHGKSNLVVFVIVDLNVYVGDCLKALVNVIHMSHYPCTYLGFVESEIDKEWLLSEIESHVKMAWLDGKLRIGSVSPPAKDPPLELLLQNPKEPEFRVARVLQTSFSVKSQWQNVSSPLC